MKRFLALLFAVLLACLCFACGKTPDDPNAGTAERLTLPADKAGAWTPAPIDADSPMIHLCRAAAIAPNEEQYDYWYTIANAITTLRAVDQELPPDEDSSYLVENWLFDAYAAALFPGVEAPNLVGCPWVGYRPEKGGYYVDLAYSTWLSAEYKDAKQNPDGTWDVTIKVIAPEEDWEWETVVKLAPNAAYNPDSPFEYHIINLAPEKFPEEAVQPLLYRIGIALSRDYVEDFDAARGAMADRCFTDALLYEFLNDELYSERIQPSYGEEYICRLTVADMLFLLRQYIGDYPKLIDPTVDMFLTRNRAGDYEYWHSDMGMVDYELQVENTEYVGGNMFELTAALYELDFDEEAEAASMLLGRYTLRLLKADGVAYGYTIIKITKG